MNISFQLCFCYQYIIYVADIQVWLNHSKATTYADDTKTSVSSKLLKFMASNGLVAHPTKTTLMFLNPKQLVRSLSESDETQAWAKSIQLTQNKLTRFLNGTLIKDQISTKSILDSLNMLSVNQINAQIKLTEAWKIINEPIYPTKWEQKKKLEDEKITRAMQANIPETAKTTMSQATYVNDAKKLWNKFPF